LLKVCKILRLLFIDIWLISLGLYGFKIIIG